MGVILDTSILIATEKRIIDFNKWRQYESVYISSVTITELLVGVHRAASPKVRIKRSAFVEHIINSISSITFGAEEARSYAQIIDDLYRNGITLGVHDMIIGATAITHGYPVLTTNKKDFIRIPSLEVLSLD
ncbi:type II toxin-antitoxin system VapC family toxin [Rickettsiaceae bacterium]|nr:type II toxin-antitoxin system VapC family toxin [Rickettsiaceae bacterium]